MPDAESVLDVALAHVDDSTESYAMKSNRGRSGREDASGCSITEMESGEGEVKRAAQEGEMNEEEKRWCPWVALASCVVLVAAWGVGVGGEAGAEVRNPKGVAVIIGNEDYEHRDVPDVKYAHRDAEAFKRYVIEVLGFDPENVIDLRDATRRQMYGALGTKRDLRGDLWGYLDPKGGSDVVVFYSGHGVPGEHDKQGYLLPVDADPKAAEEDGYPIDLLYSNLGKLAEAKTVRVYLDSCFSGGSHAGGLIRDARPVYISAELPSGAGEKVTSLTAATGKQIASWDAEARHGLFTHHLLNALYGKGDADGDGKVTAKEAKRYLDRWMTRAARRTHKRIQEASLLGAEGVVLTAAPVDGGYPERPALAGGSGATRAASTPRGGPGTGQGAGSATTPESAASVESSSPPKRESTGAASVGAAPAAAEAGLGLTRDARVLVQRGLTALKFEAGPADGLFGKRTRGAIKAWQAAKGLEATGYLTKEQAEALQAAGEEVARAEKEKVERERKAREVVERERLVREAAERERKARKQAEAERKARERAERERMKPGREFRDCGECPEMVVVPAGDYKMGSRDGDGSSDERPRHRVRLPQAFAVGKYEVTFEEWDACVAAGGCGGYRPNDRGWGRGRRPVINVSWADAKRYVEWLSGETREEYRLLSEAEWEYVTRAGARTDYWWGEEIGRGRANCNGCGSRWDGEETAPVGSFEANGFGLYDVHGNVWEWVEDCWHDSYSGAPTDGSAWTSGGDCGERVLRGGSWLDFPRNLRSANRNWYSTGYRDFTYGFRIARTLTP